MEFPEFVQWFFYSVIGFAAFRVVSALDKIDDSIKKLNTQVALVHRDCAHGLQAARMEAKARHPKP